MMTEEVREAFQKMLGYKVLPEPLERVYSHAKLMVDRLDSGGQFRTSELAVIAVAAGASPKLADGKPIESRNGPGEEESEESETEALSGGEEVDFDSLKPGDLLQVKTKDGTVRIGKFSTFKGKSALIVRFPGDTADDANKPVVVKREDVLATQK